MIKNNHSPAPSANEEQQRSAQETVRGREETPRRRKLTGDDVIVVATIYIVMDYSLHQVRTIEEAEIKIAAEKVRRQKSLRHASA